MKSKFKFPHTYVILFMMICLFTILTYVIPAGNFERTTNEAGIVMINADSYHKADHQSPISLLGMFVAIQSGFVQSASVIFLVFFAYFCVYTITKTGSLHGAIQALLKQLKGRENLTIPLFFIIYALAGSTYGEWDMIFGLIPIMVGFAIAIGYDAMVGLAISGMAVAVGFASATTNPFTIGIAHSYAELPPFSGLLFRWIAFVVFVSIGIWWTMRYANKIKKDPSKSLMYGVNLGRLEIDKSQLENSKFGWKEKLTMLLLFVTIGTIVFGTLKLGWYLDEMSAVFLMSGIIVSIIWKISPDGIVKNLLDSSAEIIIGAFIVGLSRSIIVIMQDGNILDTIVYGLYLPLANMPTLFVAEGMLIFQNIMNLFIPSGSGQAAAVMPIMLPLSDLVGLNRQIAVLAYQFGDGFSNLFWPTSGIAVMASIAKVPLDKWYKFFIPLFLLMLFVEAVFIGIAVAIGYGPF